MERKKLNIGAKIAQSSFSIRQKHGDPDMNWAKNYVFNIQVSKWLL